MDRRVKVARLLSALDDLESGCVLLLATVADYRLGNPEGANSNRQQRVDRAAALVHQACNLMNGSEPQTPEHVTGALRSNPSAG